MNNGKTNLGPPFAVCTAQGTTIVPKSAISELLEKNAAMQAKGNLALGPLFRKAAESFREWSKDAEPGWTFGAPEIGFSCIRLASNAPICTFLSDAAQQRLADQAAQADPTPQEADTPRIFRP